jgi:glyoxylase-like metal-dependent hydrolase (beta-lactamase superfamily II)/rhodanese-related sulfurtransferase
MVSLESFYLDGRALASYMVAADGVAAVIDPRRDVDVYLEAARRSGVQIAHIVETHLHRDFSCGRRQLAERTGARVYLGEGSGADFSHVAVKDGSFIRMGDCRLDILQTPGHTASSICVTLTEDGARSPRAIFTGNTLFAGDVGRPEVEDMAGPLFRSLQRLKALPDDVQILPANGSASTIGKERACNYALRARTADEFLRILTESMPARSEAAGSEDLPAALSAGDVLRLQAEGCVALDTRPTMQFAVAHVPGSVHIALSSQFGAWAARLLGRDARVVLAAEDLSGVRESRVRLARVGMEHVAGYLDTGIAGWIRDGRAADYIPQLTAKECAELIGNEGGAVRLVDVREPSEVAAGAIEGSARIPLIQLPARVDELDRRALIVAYCQGGYRGDIATSLLRRADFPRVANLTGGFDGWKAAGLRGTAAS